MKLKRFFATGMMAMVLGFGLASPVFAQQNVLTQNADTVAQAAGIATNDDLITILARIINIALSVLGIILLMLVLYAGYLWMTAAGDSKKVDQAKEILRNAIIGLVVIASAWAITSFVFGLLTGQGQFGGGVLGTGTQTPKSLKISSGALGNGPIESVLPSPNAMEVPRNTGIIVTFKEPVKPESFILGWTEGSDSVALNSNNVKIYTNSGGANTALSSDKARVTVTADRKTFVIRPVDYLGSPTKKTPYTVQLLAGVSTEPDVFKKGILKEDGSQLFGGAFKNGFQWTFEVSTVADFIPPRIIDAGPDAGGKYGRNMIAQVTFDKPMDPSTVSGKTTEGFAHLVALSTDAQGQNPAPVPGEFIISNQYRSVEFIPDESCGKNSCGQEVRCFPGNSTIQMKVVAANLAQVGSPQGNLTSNGYDGVVSMVGNSLDGNKNGTAEGPNTDSATWSFATDNNIVLEPPQIESTIPEQSPVSGESSSISLDEPFIAKFNTRLRPSTLNSETVKIDAHGAGEKNQDTFWWNVGMRLLANDGSEYVAENNPTPAAKAAIVISHRTFLPSGEKPEELNFYDPYFYQGVQSMYQNCMSPAAACGLGKNKISANQMNDAQVSNCCNGKSTNELCTKTLNP